MHQYPVTNPIQLTETKHKHTLTQTHTVSPFTYKFCTLPGRFKDAEEAMYEL